MEVFLTKEANSEETDGGGEAKKRKLNSDWRVHLHSVEMLFFVDRVLEFTFVS
jgi:hypothetical protein